MTHTNKDLTQQEMNSIRSRVEGAAYEGTAKKYDAPWELERARVCNTKYTLASLSDITSFWNSCVDESIAKAAAERQAEAAKRAQKSDAVNAIAKALPELQGSPKQISWAERIRIDALNSFRNYDATEVVAKIASVTSAGDWIDMSFKTKRENWDTIIGVYDRSDAAVAESSRMEQEIAIAEAMAAAQVVAAPKGKKEIMARAWAIAREAATKFGGKSKEYLAEAMKQAWAESKA